MGLGILLFWGALIVAIVLLAKRSRNPDAPAERQLGKSALDILNERYACGEIGRDEFEQKKRDLMD
jgi:putative membrane protein